MKECKGTKTPVEIRDLWQTPKEIFNFYKKMYKLSFDVAANNKNHMTDCYYDFLSGEDALKEPWSMYGNWCNPPYSNIKPWVEKAIKEMREGNLTVMLIPSDTSASWFRLAYDHCSECHLISGRISFVRADTQERQSGNNKGSVVFVFNPKSLLKSQVTLIDRNSMR
jgi:phage N-6-adenine-methyltransferase